MLNAKPRFALSCLALLLALASNAFAQICEIGDLQLDSQTAVDSFPVDFLECSELVGNLHISSSAEDPITNLNGLEGIQIVTGDLHIVDNAQLPLLQGLNELLEVGGRLIISNNDSLQYIDALGALDNIGLELEISENPLLVDVDLHDHLLNDHLSLDIRLNESLATISLPNSTNSFDKIDISHNINLIEVSGCDACMSVDTLSIYHNPEMLQMTSFPSLLSVNRFEFISNKSILELGGFDALQHIGELIFAHNSDMLAAPDFLSLESCGNIRFYENHSLVALDGFNSLLAARDLYVHRNNELISIEGFASLDSLSERVTISSNRDLLNISSFENLRTVDHFDIHSNDELETIAGFTALSHVEETFRIFDNGNLQSLASFNALQEVGSHFEIRENEGQFTISGFDSLASLHGDLAIESNPGLLAVEGFNQLLALDNSYLGIQSNALLAQLVGFDSLLSTSEALIRENPMLSSIEGFASLDSLTNLALENNTALSSLDAFESLRHVSEYLIIRENHGAFSLVGFNTLQTVGTSFIVDNNFEMQSMEGFDAVNSLSSLRIDRCPNLEEMNAFHQLDSVGRFVLEDAPLSNLNAFDSLRTVNRMTISGTDFIDLQSFSRLEKIDEDLEILQNGSLVNLDGLQNLQQVGGILTIAGNPQLQSIESFDSLDPALLDGLEILYCDQLSLCNAPKLCEFIVQNLDEVDINNQDAICQKIDDFLHACEVLAENECLLQGATCNTDYELIELHNDYPECSIIAGDLILSEYFNSIATEPQIRYIKGNLIIREGYAAYDGLAALDSIAKDLVIENSAGNSASFRLDSLKKIGKTLHLRNMNSLADLQFLSSLREIKNIVLDSSGISQLTGLENLEKIDGYLSVSNEPFLEDFDGLNNLEEISSFLLVRGNEALQSFEGLERLSSIDQYLHIYDNASIQNLSGLENLQRIGSALHVVGNQNLESLDGLGPMESSYFSNLLIKENPSLSTCHSPVICPWMTDNEELAIVYDNAPSCNGTPEILELCSSTSSIQVRDIDFPILYPNPCQQLVHIELSDEERFSLTVLDQFGRHIWQVPDVVSPLEVSSFPSGLYILVFVDEAGFEQRYKLWKQ